MSYLFQVSGKAVAPALALLIFFASGCVRSAPKTAPVQIHIESGDRSGRTVSAAGSGKRLPLFIEKYNSGVMLLDRAIRMGKPLDDAEREFEAALLLKPGFFSALYNIAYISCLGGRYDDALRNIEAALSYRQTKEAELLKALVLAKSKEWDLALVQYLRVAKKYGEPGLAFGRAGMVLMTQRRYGEALKYFEKSGKLKKETYQIFINKGTCYLNTASYQKAAEAYGAVYALGIRGRYLLGQYAFTLRKTGNIKMALNVYKELIGLYPDETSAYKNAGVVYDLYLNRPEEAVGYYDRYIELGGRDGKNVANWRRIAVDRSGGGLQ